MTARTRSFPSNPTRRQHPGFRSRILEPQRCGSGKAHVRDPVQESEKRSHQAAGAWGPLTEMEYLAYTRPSGRIPKRNERE